MRGGLDDRVGFETFVCWGVHDIEATRRTGAFFFFLFFQSTLVLGHENCLTLRNYHIISYLCSSLETHFNAVNQRCILFKTRWLPNYTNLRGGFVHPYRDHLHVMLLRETQICIFFFFLIILEKKNRDWYTRWWE